MSAAFGIQVEGGKAQRGVQYILIMRCRVRGTEGTMRAMVTGDLLLDAVDGLQALQQLCRDKAREPGLELISARAMEYPTHLDVTTLEDRP